MKQVITKGDVEKAIKDLTAAGTKPTQAAIYAALGRRGGMGTLVRLIGEIQAEAQLLTESPEGRRLFLQVWALAVAEGRAQQDAAMAELKESVTALAKENEHLEGTLLAEKTRAGELSQEKSRLEKELSNARIEAASELKQARAAQTEAMERANIALQQLNDSRSAYTTQFLAMQADLKAATGKAHGLEIGLARATALLEAKGIQPPVITSQQST
jgi:chromosome segregation ATPase